MSVKTTGARATIERIRELIKRGLGTCEIARLTKRSAPNISNIRHGRRHNNVKPMTINELGVVRVVGKKLCRVCGDPMVLAAHDGRCLECTVGELGRKGVISIKEAG